MIDQQTILAGLNREQRVAVAHTDGPLLILAGAGAGKTAVITHRAVRLVADGVSPETLLIVTFTNKAASELKSRCQQLLGSRARALKVGTYHSVVTHEILRPAARAGRLASVGINGRFAILDRDASERVFKTALKTLTAREAEALTQSGRSPHDLRRAIGAIRALGYEFGLDAGTLVPRVARWIAATRFSYRPAFAQTALLALWQRYTQSCRELNALDFDALLTHAAWLLRQDTEFAAQASARYRYLEVDEYQDTNPVQAEIVERLAAPHHNLAVCGDDRQSIYAFRGADLEVLRGFCYRYPEATVVDLIRNYRSSAPIVAAANACARAMPERLSTEDMISAALASRPFRPRGFSYPTEAEEASDVVKQLCTAHALGRPWSGCAVIYRARFDKTVLEPALVRARVPFQVVGDTGFFDHIEVRDMAALVRVLVEPSDRPAWCRLLGAGGFGLTPKALQLACADGEHPLAALTRLSQLRLKACFKLRSLLTQIARFTTERTQTLPDVHALVVGVILENAHPETFQEYLLALWAMYLKPHLKVLAEREAAKRYRVNRGGAARRDALVAEILIEREQRVRVIAAHLETERRAALGWDGILEALELESLADEGVEPECVKLMTVHAAKGLEFDEVWFLGGGDEDAERRPDVAVQAEERRVFYVALTRARQALTVTESAWRKRYGHLIPRRRSLFLAEILPALDAAPAPLRPSVCRLDSTGSADYA